MYQLRVSFMIEQTIKPHNSIYLYSIGNMCTKSIWPPVFPWPYSCDFEVNAGYLSLLWTGCDRIAKKERFSSFIAAYISIQCIQKYAAYISVQCGKKYNKHLES